MTVLQNIQIILLMICFYKLKWVKCLFESSQPIYIITNTSLQCYSVLSDNLVTNELCIPLERGLNVPSTGEGFICLSPPSKLKIAVLFCFIYKKTSSFSAIVF